MARINPAGQSWGAWFRPRYAAMGMSGAEFAQRVADAGGSATTSKQTVSQWVNGQNSTDANTACVIAGIFGEFAADALRAAGYGIVADEMEDRTQRPGRDPEPLDEGIRLILARKSLTPEQQAKEIARYKRRLAQLLADTADILDTVAGPRDQAKSA